MTVDYFAMGKTLGENMKVNAGKWLIGLTIVLIVTIVILALLLTNCQAKTAEAIQPPDFTKFYD